MNDLVTIEGKQFEVLLKDENDYIVAVMDILEKDDCYMSVNVYYVVSWLGDFSVDSKHTPTEIEDYLHAAIKRDGCCHVWFGERTDDKDTSVRDSYLHLCGANYWKDHVRIMEELYKYASRHIKEFDNSELWDKT